MPQRYRILLLCGTGIATSTAVRMRISEALKAQGLAASAELRQGKIADILRGGVDADLIVSTAQVPKNITVPVINGVPLLAGPAGKPVLDQIVDAVRKGST